MVLRQQRDKPKLLENLWHFQHKDCLLARDKIYSLLSVSQHGHNVAVDYSTSDIKVALDLFRHEPSFCLRQAQFVLKALDIRYIVRNHGLGELDDDANVPSFVELRARALPPGPYTCPVCGDAIEVETEHMLTSPSVQNLYVYCLSCSHSVEAPLQYFVHGHIILARGSPETAAGGKVTKWWIFLHQIAAPRWSQVVGAVAITALSAAAFHVSFRLSFRAFFDAASAPREHECELLQTTSSQRCASGPGEGTA